MDEKCMTKEDLSVVLPPDRPGYPRSRARGRSHPQRGRPIVNRPRPSDPEPTALRTPKAPEKPGQFTRTPGHHDRPFAGAILLWVPPWPYR